MGAPKAGQRQSNLELLRIVAMLMIILVHYSGHGGGFYVLPSLQKYQAMFFVIGGQIGVNLFVMLSGYFLSTSAFKFSRIARIWLQTFFYSVGIAALLAALGWISWDAVGELRTLLPVGTNAYWFVDIYTLLFLISPILNGFIKSADKKQYHLVLLIMFLLTSVYMTLVWSGSYLYSFCNLYLIAGYIRKFDPPVLKKPKWALLSFFLVYLAFFGVMQFFYHVVWGDLDNSARDYLADRLTRGFTPWILLLAVLLFLAFKNMNIKHSRIINTLSSAAFGVYLIHDNNHLRDFLWQHIVGTKNVYYNNWYFVFALLTAAAIYLIAAAIDLARQYLLERPLFALFDRIGIGLKKRFGKKEDDPTA